jgi:hypothetical protein
MTARVAARASNLNQATAASSAPMATCHVRPFKRIPAAVRPVHRLRAAYPAGKSPIPIFGSRVKRKINQIKNISVLQNHKSPLDNTHPVPARGAYHDRHDRGTGRGGRESCDRRARLKRTAKTCGPDVAVLASMHLEATASQGATEAKEPFSGESTI